MMEQEKAVQREEMNEVTETPTKIYKNPNRVAAGKRLAELNTKKKRKL